MAIVLPIYNAQAYISDCLDSILAQSYIDWTAYCVDDGSCDGTASILDEYAKRDARIKVFHIENTGASNARNYAIDRIENEKWISFVDADDYIGPQMYERIITAIGEDDIDYVRLYSIQTLQRYDKTIFVTDSAKEVICKTVSREDYFLNENVGGYTHSLFIKAEIVRDNNIRFCKDMKMLEDQAFSITCATYANKILMLEQPRNYFYYKGNISSITISSRDTSDDIIRCVNIVYSAFVNMCSTTVLNDYFYQKYLPQKIDNFVTKRIRYLHTKTSKQFLPAIKISMDHLSIKARMKYIVVKLLNLM